MIISKTELTFVWIVELDDELHPIRILPFLSPRIILENFHHIKLFVTKSFSVEKKLRQPSPYRTELSITHGPPMLLDEKIESALLSVCLSQVVQEVKHVFIAAKGAPVSSPKYNISRDPIPFTSLRHSKTHIDKNTAESSMISESLQSRCGYHVRCIPRSMQ